ncbi:mannose-1-phosphate guanylyltransferase [Desulfosporosinus fructosivorans]|uniref:Mannose-1-phosphate guanylyltransferase n=1 Tax=Desulfosporosinus fructosivorans TaxID=2018669 RepID=A0A4Z0R5W9_9FIRM|nr:sugar phosphate nucleotidyltransferase [Desulfosporosinus fructosivorans]TGE37839.1 mannose-1-phosphate guanylyltransferase [Desulfosporosinus fructosivorans]
MRLILLSGGSGQRLWPLSNDSRSKQFLKVLENGNGERESMVQRIWGQLKAVGLTKSAVIATNQSQVNIIQSQLGESIEMVVEPERRDTYPAIALASAYLSSVKQVSHSEVVAVVPVDSYVDYRFFNMVKELEDVLNDTAADLALVAVKPTYPSERHGYIVPELKQDGVDRIKVSYFKEKPTKELALELIERQSLWNCGVFAFKLGYVLSKLEENSLPVDYLDLKREYALLPKISFDYEVVEKARKVIAIRYQGEWKDLGTWNTLTEEIPTPIIGNGVLSEDCRGTHLINELDIPIFVLGLSNVVVAASPDGILVSDKKASPKLKDLAKGFIQRPMFEERRWGWYRVLDHVKYENGNEVLTKRIRISAGKNLSYQVHYLRSEIWSITNGTGEFALDDVIYQVKPGDVLRIPVGSKHGILADTDLEFIEVQTGSQLKEEDITRIFVNWKEVTKHCETVQNKLALCIN